MSGTRVWQGQQRRVFLQEVGPRDGLQAETVFVPTEQKVALVNALTAAGLAKIEVTALVSPKAIPALSDAEAVLAQIERRPGVVYSALVPNVRGAERAVSARVDELNLVMSATEEHNLSNLRMTREQSYAGLKAVAEAVRGSGVAINVSLSCSFGCPMSGDVDPEQVMDWSARFIEDLGAQGVSLCDTTGMAYPSQVAELTDAFRARWPQSELTLHFHNTRGMGLANLLAGLDAGAERFDASFGGIGGCPYAPGASGNICTEEIAHALALMGYDTGIDLNALLAAARQLQSVLGRDLPSQLLKAGQRLDLHPLPASFADIAQRAAERGHSPSV